jgi:hypothetical protein
MPVSLENGFYQTHDFAHVSGLYVDSKQFSKCIEEIKSKKIKGVFGSPAFGFKEDNLDFLASMPWVEAIWFWDVSLKNIDGIYTLKNLRFFGCHPKRPPINFEHFENLQSAVIEPKAKDTGLSSLSSLELLHVWHYKPKNKDFLSLDAPKSLKELQINWANPSSLESLPDLPKLKKLEVHRCRNLEKLGDLNAKYPSLEHLVVDACGKVSKSEAERTINSFKNLKHAYIQGQRFP